MPDEPLEEIIRSAPHARHCEASTSMFPGPCSCWKRDARAALSTQAEEQRIWQEIAAEGRAFPRYRLNDGQLTPAPVSGREARLEAALKFYADEANYDAIGPRGTVKGPAWRLVEDRGAIAREALTDE